MDVYSSTLVQRFWSKVKVGAPSECWEWQASRNRSGYGNFTAFRSVLAHRFAYEITYGKPNKKCICHHCDNPSCVNPNHLFEGSDRDNSDDKVKKGRARGAKGESNGRAKLSHAQVSECKTLMSEGVYLKQIARAIGVTPKLLRLIRNGVLWPEVAPA